MKTTFKVTQVNPLTDDPSQDIVTLSESDIEDEVAVMMEVSRMMDNDGSIRRVFAGCPDSGFVYISIIPRETARIAAHLDYQQHAHGHICDDDCETIIGVDILSEGRVFEGD